MSLLDAILGRVTEVKSAKDGADLKIHVSRQNMPDDVITWKDKYVIVRDQEKADRPKTPIEQEAEKPKADKEHFEGMNPPPSVTGTEKEEETTGEIKKTCETCRFGKYDGPHDAGGESGNFILLCGHSDGAPEEMDIEGEPPTCSKWEPKAVDAEDPDHICRMDQCPKFYRDRNNAGLCRWDDGEELVINLAEEDEGIWVKHYLCREEDEKQKVIGVDLGSTEGDTTAIATMENGQIVDVEFPPNDQNPPATRGVDITVVDDVGEPKAFKRICRGCLDRGTDRKCLIKIPGIGTCENCGASPRRLFMVPIKEDQPPEQPEAPETEITGKEESLSEEVSETTT